MSKIIASLIILAIISSCVCREEVALNFLEDTSAKKADVLVIVKSTVQFINGLYSGFAVLNVTDTDACLAEATNPEIIASFKKIITIAESIRAPGDVAAGLRNIIAESVVILQKFEAAQKTCELLPKEYKDLFGKIATYAGNAEYIQKVAMHAVMNLGKFTEEGQAGVDSFKAGKFFESGKAFGGIAKFAFFYDFKM